MSSSGPDGSSAAAGTVSSATAAAVRKDELRGIDRPIDLATYKDEYREGLQQIIDAKIAGREVVAPEVEAPPKVVNLMEALRKSLDRVSSEKKKTASAAPKPVAAERAAAPKRKRA